MLIAITLFFCYEIKFDFIYFAVLKMGLAWIVPFQDLFFDIMYLNIFFPNISLMFVGVYVHTRATRVERERDSARRRTYARKKRRIYQKMRILS